VRRSVYFFWEVVDRLLLLKSLVDRLTEMASAEAFTSAAEYIVDKLHPVRWSSWHAILLSLSFVFVYSIAENRIIWGYTVGCIYIYKPREKREGGYRQQSTLQCASPPPPSTTNRTALLISRQSYRFQWAGGGIWRKQDTMQMRNRFLSINFFFYSFFMLTH
jgi:hypothetical protein